jgi:phosphopantetheine--protein transferase-like protein
MKLGIGTDVEEAARFTKAIRNRTFLLRTFSKKEIEYCQGRGSPERHFAGTFAAKEATFKAVQQLCPTRISLLSFEILHHRSGLPYLKINSSTLRQHVKVNVSISHSSNYAVAVALAVSDR